MGKRAADRPVWPVAVVLAMTLPSTMLLPNLAALAPVRDNVLLLTAVAAACAVPFLPRSSAYWREPVPTAYGRPAAARWARVPLMPFWRRVLSRPNLLLELLLIRVGYSLYSHIRAAAPTSRSLAEGNGSQIHGIERALGIDIEHAVNHAVVNTPWLEAFFNFYYTSFHFVVPLTILGVLYWRRPGDYRWARASLGLATVLALIGFWLYPLAPPRLMPGLGFIDTVHGPQDLANPSYGAMTAISNQYAAMPSLHFGWSLWCGIVIVVLAPKGWQKLLGALHPLITVCAIVATANHWVLDAVGGAVVVSMRLRARVRAVRAAGPARQPPGAAAQGRRGTGGARRARRGVAFLGRLRPWGAPPGCVPGTCTRQPPRRLRSSVRSGPGLSYPTRRATAASGRSVVRSKCSACSTRRSCTSPTGVRPSVRATARWSVRSLTPSSRAASAIGSRLREPGPRPLLEGGDQRVVAGQGAGDGVRRL